MLWSTSCLESHLPMSLVQMVYIVLLLTMEALVSRMGMLVLKNLCENSFSVLISLSSLNVKAIREHKRIYDELSMETMDAIDNETQKLNDMGKKSYR